MCNYEIHRHVPQMSIIIIFSLEFCPFEAIWICISYSDLLLHHWQNSDTAAYMRCVNLIFINIHNWSLTL